MITWLDGGSYFLQLGISFVNQHYFEIDERRFWQNPDKEWVSF